MFQVDKQTDTGESITFLQLRIRAGKTNRRNVFLSINKFEAKTSRYSWVVFVTELVVSGSHWYTQVSRSVRHTRLALRLLYPHDRMN